MPEPNSANGGEQQDPPVPPTLDEATKTYVNSIIEQRLNRQKTQHQKDLEAKDAAIQAAVEAALTAEREKHKGGKKDGEKTPEQIEAEKEQFKSILDGEKAVTKREREAREAAEARAKGFEELNKRILKDVAIRDAIADQDTFRFHNIDVVRKLTEDRVSFDEETGTFQVKDENGVVMQNNSLQPLSLKEYFAQYAASHPYLVSSNAKGGTGSGESNRTVAGGLAKVTSKADLKTVKEKSEYITKFGYDAFEKLPVK